MVNTWGKKHPPQCVGEVGCSRCSGISVHFRRNTHSALARRGREVTEDQELLEIAKNNLQRDWDEYLILEVNQSVVELAGEYAETFALRGYDSVQLATASILQQHSDNPILFACFDRRLNQAAKILGMQIPFN